MVIDNWLSPDGDRIFHRRVAEIRRFFFGGPSRWMLVYETPKNVPETLKDRRAGSPGRRLSMHSKKLRLTWSANHLVRGGASDHFPWVLGVLNFNTSTLQHFNTSTLQHFNTSTPQHIDTALR